MNLTFDTITTMLSDGWRPARGHCFIHLDSPPTMAGLLHIPELSQEMQITDAVWRGRVLAINYSNEWAETVEDFGELPITDDRVLLLLRAEDMDRSVIVTANTRIVAVIES